MKIVQTIILKVLSVVVLAGGAVLVVIWFNTNAYEDLGRIFADHVWTRYGALCGLVLLILGLLGVLPLSRPRRTKNVISFEGTHGSVTIELDSVEANLGRVVSKMPVVRKIKVHVTPSEDHHRAQVDADVLMYKGASGESAREIANHIADYLMDAAINILGVEDVTQVNLNVRDIVVDAKQLSLARTRPVQDKPGETAGPAAALPAAVHGEPPYPTPEVGSIPEDTSFNAFSLSGGDTGEAKPSPSEGRSEG
jgi:hypothetical protein